MSLYGAIYTNSLKPLLLPISNPLPPPHSTTNSSDSKRDAYEASYDMDGDCFIKGNIAINSSGVAMRDSDRSFTVLYEELEVGPIIGRGASSYVQRATHRPTGTQLALKVINMFDKSKRDQLIKEVAVLYNADCPAFVSFYGAGGGRRYQE